MKTRTRLFLVVAVGVLILGLGTGLVASYMGGLQNFALIGTNGPEELTYVPKDAQLVAFANVRDVMDSELRHKLADLRPDTGQPERSFTEATGVNPETDIDRVVAAMTAAGDTSQPPLVLARGRFDEVRIEGVIREHGGTVEEYRGKRLLVVKETRPTPPGTPEPAQRAEMVFAVAFAEPGLLALGPVAAVRRALDTKATGVDVTGNPDLMRLIHESDNGNAWAVARFDAVAGRAKLPSEIASRIPPITWFSASGHVNGGLSGRVTAETKDDVSAQNLRDVVRGFMALARLQVGQRPDFVELLDSLQLGGEGKTVSLDFAIPTQVIDALASMRTNRRGGVPSSPAAPLAPASPELPGSPTL